MSISNLDKPVLAFSAFIFAAAISANAVAQPSCGSVITTDTTLSEDLLGCPGRGLSIIGSNVTLDCNGHTIEAAGSRVVEVFAGLSNVTLENCVLISTANTDALRVGAGATNVVITGNDIATSGFQSRGIRIFETSESTISGNTLTTTGLLSDGIRLSTSSNNLITGNTISTSAEGARGFLIDFGSDNNVVSGNIVHTTGPNSNGVRLRAGSDGNVIERNVLRSDNTHPVRIESSSNNVLHENTLTSDAAWLRSRRFTLQNGGLSVHPDGRVFAVENNFGAAEPSFGIGVTTTLIEADVATGRAVDTTRLVQGGNDLDFGFDALEITPGGRFIALRGGGRGEIYEIDPVTGAVSFIFNGPGINGLESIVENVFLGTSNDGLLWSVDLSVDPPAIFPIGGAFPGWTDIAIHPVNRKVYLLSRHSAEGSGTNHLYEADLLNGLFVRDIGDTGVGFVSDMDFAPDGTLYGNAGDLLVIDPNTAVAERVGGFGEDPFEPPSENNVLSKTTLVDVGGGGSVHYPGVVAVPDGVPVDITTSEFDISFNRVFVDSASHPFLDQEAVITLLGLPGEKRRLLVDLNDDGEFERCLGDRCRPRLFKGGTLVFDVDGLTTYSSEERTR